MQMWRNFLEITEYIYLEMVGRIFAFTCLPVLFVRRLWRERRDGLDEVWLIGENQGECTKDNGYAFYQYCRKHYPEKRVYFLIKRTSVYYDEDVLLDEHLVHYGSMEHMVLFARARLCFYTHTYRDVMYRRFYEVYGGNKILVYLHHGTLGFKKFNPFYQAKNNIMSLFTVGSNLEKDILTNQAGVEDRRVRITGYARYDTMKSETKAGMRQVVFMPTHRGSRASLREIREFADVINSFVNNPDLAELLRINGITLKVVMHPSMQKVSHRLKSRNALVEIISLGQESTQDLICRSDLLITDYSSVSWDFFYLGKPVLFYRFDIDRYMEDRSSYIDLREELIGEIATEEERLVELIRKYVAREFQLDDKFSAYRHSIMPNIDTSNCQRIYEEVSTILRS